MQQEVRSSLPSSEGSSFHHHQSLNREGHWGTTYDFATSFAKVHLETGFHFAVFPKTTKAEFKKQDPRFAGGVGTIARTKGLIPQYGMCQLSLSTAYTVRQHTSVLRTTYTVIASKNPRQISHMVCTKQMVIAPFHNLLSVQVYPCSVAVFVSGSLTAYFWTDLAPHVTRSVKKKKKSILSSSCKLPKYTVIDFKFIIIMNQPSNTQ